ncbi:SusC/RagA family TonB-linked outer membrane protein [Bacteroidia bacterium]|nr:SusC/RagA family TonB-linked outer membrane protein [Bacteroidia bacterium]
MKHKLRKFAKGLLIVVAMDFAGGGVQHLRAEAPQDVKIAVSGSVSDADGPIIGASVVEKGNSGNGTATDVDGRYSLRVSSNATLEVSYLGYTTQEVPVNGQTTINVALAEGASDLDEVVVIGYGSVKKKDLTGAVSVISTENMAKAGASTIASSIQGLATGVNVRNTGVAGGDGSIEIRGIGNLSNNNPLWVVDGMVTTAGSDFNSNDVESIQILKDASAAAIYGSRAANGVIIVTTKKGKKGPLTVDVSVRESWEWSPRYDLMNAAEYKKYNDMAYDEGIKDGVWSGAKQAHWDNDTDWQDETMQTALVQDYNVTLSGGSENGNYLVSGGYYNNDGIIYGNSFDRYTFRVNTEGKKGRFSFGETFNFAQTKQDRTQTSSYIDMIRMLPTIPVYDERNLGGYGYGSEANARTFATNPIAREDIEASHTTVYRLRGTVWGELKLFDFLKYKINGGVDYIFDYYDYFRKEGNWTLNQEYRDPTGSKQNIKETNELIEHTLDFNKDFGKHHVDAVAGLTYQHYYRETVGGQRLKFPYLGSEYFTVLDAGQENQTNWNSIGESALISYLGRANYTYDNKYYLTLTFRKDGTSKLSTDNRWESYPSISGAWRISEENFFNVDWISDLKLRANYGELGNAAIGNWDYIGTVSPSIVAVFGTNQSLVNGATQVKLNNGNIRWERTAQTNIGFDAAFLSQRLAVTAEYYKSETKDVLTQMQISMTTGNQGGNPYVNAANITNSGFELSANWKDYISDVKYAVGAGLTTLSNKINDLGYGKTEYYTGQTVSRVGHALGEYYLLKTDGLFRTQTDIDNYVTSKGAPIYIEGKRPQLGDVRYIDTDDNGAINPNDRQIVGNPWADFTLSLNASLEWNNFDFYMMWYGQIGNDVLNSGMRQGRLFADNSNYIRFEKGHEPYQENPNSDFPRIVYNDTRNTRGDMDRWLEDGSYFKMKTIQVGYTFKKNALSRFGINSLRAYVSGNNLLTLTKYKGLDPDFQNSDIWDRGTDNMAFPNPYSIQCGLQVNF